MNFLNYAHKNEYLTDIKPAEPFNNFTADISDISWASNNSPIFAITSFDGELRVFEVMSGFKSQLTQQLSYKFALPVLKCTWNDQCNQIFVGLLDGSIKSYDLYTTQVVDIAKENTAISCLQFIPSMNSILTGGYQPNFHIWQIGNPSPTMTISTNNAKIFTMHLQFPYLVAGLADQKIMIMDITNQSTKVFIQSSELGKKSQIQSIAVNFKREIIGVASFDGRANISNFVRNVNGTFSSKSIITFKSNKHEEDGDTFLFPINSVSFNPRNDKWFMTAGSDGAMHFWDYELKNKIKSLHFAEHPICVARVNSSGDMVAYALGNDWHLGEEGIGKWPVKIAVHLITENQIKFTK